MKRISQSLLALILSFTTLACRITSAPSPSAPLPPITHPFDYYGWVYVFYTEANNDFARISSYTNTAFAVSPEQIKILAPWKFEHIIYMLNETATLESLYADMGLTFSNDSFHAQVIPEYREKFFAAYRQFLARTKAMLLSADVYDQVDVFYLADEPALHRNIYLDQAFLNQLADEFKTVFPDKLSAMTFAATDDPQAISQRPQSGPHFDPPPSLDLIMVDPYFYDLSGEADIPCDRSAINAWLYHDHPLSNIQWAKSFSKPIIVVGDAEIRGGRSAQDCHVQETYAILQDDPAITGLVWFIYDKEYDEGGYIRGAANDPHLLNVIENLGRK